jgi:hypothetical protein
VRRSRTLEDLAPIVAVPLLLALLDVIAGAWRGRAAEYVMLPPFAVIVFLLFSPGPGRFDNLRSIVILPCIGAAAGAACWHVLGPGPGSLALATLAVLVAQLALRAYMPPALALAALASLLRADVAPYVTGVAIGTSIIGIAFVLWRRMTGGGIRTDICV